MEQKCCHSNNTQPNYKVTIDEVIEEPCCNSNNISNKKHKCLVYCPLIITFIYIIGGSVISQYPFQPFDYMSFLSVLMGLFLVTLSYLKMLNLKGFSMSFSKYDVITKKCICFGYVYPFIELILGVFYLLGVFPIQINAITIFVLLFGGIEVIVAVWQKKDIECACMGALGFNLPLGYVTIGENFTMIIMAIIMIILNSLL